MQKSILKSGAIITVVICVEKLVGFLNQIVFAACFGSNASTDAYYLAQNIVSIINNCYNRALPLAFVSIFAYEYKKSTEEKANLMSNMINTGTLVSFVLSMIVFVCAPLIAQLTRGTADSELTLYIRSLSILVILFCISGLFGASLECNDQFVPSKLASLFLNVSGITGMLLLGKIFGVVVAIYAMIVGIALHALYEIVLYRKQFSFRLFYVRKDPRVLKAFRLSIPIMLSTALHSINSLIDKVIAARISDGAVSALNYANLVSIDLVSAVLVTAISSILVSNFAKCVANGNYAKLEEHASRTIEMMLCAIVWISVAYIVNAKEIISVAFQRGAFDAQAVQMTSVAFVGYAVGLVFLPFQEVMIRVQYAFHDSKQPMINSIMSMVLNTVISIFLATYFGIVGIAIGTSVAILSNCILNTITAKKAHSVKINLKVKDVLIMSVAGAVSFAVNVALLNCIGIQQALPRFLFSAGAGLIVYIAVLVVGKCKPFFELLHIAREISKR